MIEKNDTLVMRKVPHFNLDFMECRGIYRINLNGIYIGRVFDYYKNGGFQFVPKGFDDSFISRDITLKTFKTVDEVKAYLKRRITKRYEKHGELI